MTHSLAASRMERAVSGILRAGVLVSAIMIVVGLVLLFAGQGGLFAGHAPITLGYMFPRTVGAIMAAVVAGSGLGFIQLGILLLIMTPIFRVAASVVLFARASEKPMTIVTLAVFLLLLASFAVGLIIH